MEEFALLVHGFVGYSAWQKCVWRLLPQLMLFTSGPYVHNLFGNCLTNDTVKFSAIEVRNSLFSGLHDGLLISPSRELLISLSSVLRVSTQHCSFPRYKIVEIMYKFRFKLCYSACTPCPPRALPGSLSIRNYLLSCSLYSKQFCFK